MRPAWLAAAALVWSGPSCGQIVSVKLLPPARTFGVFVGDVLTSTAILQVLPGTALDPRSLPPEGPASPTIDVRRVRVGGTPARIEIRVTYQSFFSPEQVSGAEVPGYTLAFSAGGKRLSASVPSFGFTASTFRHDLQPSLDPAALRPDHAPMLAHATTAAWKIAAGLLSVAGGLLALAWPYVFSVGQLPFRRAAKQLARLQRMTKVPGQSRQARKNWGEWSHSPQTPQHSAGRTGWRSAVAPAGGDAALEAMLVLHRAFDATDGRRIFADDLNDFVSRHQHFLPLRPRIAAFFDLSRAVFFGADVPAPEIASWMGLCRDLARAEQSG